MELQSVDIRLIDQKAALFPPQSEGMVHVKSLPVLSVVQSLQGSYGISIDGGEQYQTHAGGLFIAPRDRVQRIEHHVDARSGVMRARWLFLDVEINGKYRLEDAYDLPVVPDAQAQERISGLMDGLMQEPTLCRRQALLYLLADVLISVSQPRALPDPFAASMRDYVEAHHAQRLSAERLAAQFRLSVPTLYRRFREHFGMSSANFVNSVRLRRAALYLERTDLSIRDVAQRVGFEDEFYFSRLFRANYLRSPAAYCKAVRNPSAMDGLQREEKPVDPAGALR